MNKVMTVGFAALMAAGIAGAQDDVVMTGMAPSAPAEPEVTAQAALLSSYVWRGQVYNNDFVIQPQITLSQYDVSLNVWANYDMAGANAFGVSDDISELDLTLAYTLPIDINELAFDVGAIYYTFPNTLSPSTAELYARATVTSWASDEYVVPVIPSVTLFGDVDEVKGLYVLFDVHAPYAVSDVLTVAGGISAGYGNTSYNDYYFPNGPGPDPTVGSSQDAGWNDYNFYGTASYQITDAVSAQFNMTYTMLEGGAIRDAAKQIYDNKEKFWGGFGIAYDF